mgnify:CR=1 FL=1
MKKNKVLVVAVHPDDETLGCGGTLLKHRSQGDEIFWLIMTTIKKDNGFRSEYLSKRNAEIKRVSRAFGFKKTIQMDFPVIRIDEVPRCELVKKIAQCFKEIQPNILYLPFKFDVHSDHKTVFEVAYSCTKHFRHPYLKKILMMETISETEFAPALAESTFMPNCFFDISDFLNKKIAIMKLYKSELGKHPFPRSVENIKALATFRGATAGCRYAESFMTLKEVI